MRSGVVYKISELNTYVKNLLSSDLNLFRVSVRGEIINLKKYASAYYFTLKENDDARISSLTFNLAKFAKDLKDGDEVIATGRVTLHEKSGTYQLIAEEVSYSGLGAKLVALAKLKEKLEKTDIFSREKKLKLQKFPNTVGVIAPKDSAALADIVTNIERRYPLVTLVVVNATFQGENAPSSLINAFNEISKVKLDVLIIARGGGSSDDLWAFNDEQLVLALSKRQIPLISAIGHEIDTTLVDYVSDVRASTPTAAAELAVPSREEIIQTIIEYTNRLTTSVENKLDHASVRLQNLLTRPVLTSYDNVINNLSDKVASNKERYENAFKARIMSSEQKVERLTNSLIPLVLKFGKKEEELLSNYKVRIDKALDYLLNKANENIVTCQSKLESLNPLSVLKRGYALVSQDEVVITSIKNIKQNKPLTVQMHDGKLSVKVRIEDE